MFLVIRLAMELGTMLENLPYPALPTLHHLAPVPRNLPLTTGLPVMESMATGTVLLACLPSLLALPLPVLNHQAPIPWLIITVQADGNLN